MDDQPVEPQETVHEPEIPSLETVSNEIKPSSTTPGQFPCMHCDFIAKNKLGLAIIEVTILYPRG